MRLKLVISVYTDKDICQVKGMIMADKDNNNTVEFKGNVVRCVFNSESFKVYAVDFDKKQYPNIKKNKYNNVSICGDLPNLILGVEYEITAKEESNKYGVSYRVINIKRDLPKSRNDIFTFLNEILTFNQASVLYENYPDIIDRVKEDRLDGIDLGKLHGIGEVTFDKIKNKIVENFCLIDIVSEFKGIISLSMLKKIYDKYPSIETLKYKLKIEPYKTLTRVSGIGFKIADSIVIQMQKELDTDFGYDVLTSPDRCLACIMYILQENENEGHTKMNLQDLRKECYNIVPECADNFVDVIKDDNIYYNKMTMDVALRSTYETERYIAETILDNLDTEDRWDFDVDKYKNVGEFELSDEQISAIRNVCDHKISILNGAAGTGKSQSTLAIINMLDDNCKTYMLLAPTGKASKVISEYTNRQASTIHRGLGFIPGENVWTYGTDNKLNVDIVIIDEFSMVDIHLFKRVINAIDFDNTKLLIIGDNAQLCSVGCGNLLHDFMESNRIPTVTLSKVFRYGEGGLMKIATDVRHCSTYLDSSMKSKAVAFGDNKDYMFIDTPTENTVLSVVSLYKKLLDNGNSIEDIQVLTAKNVGDQGSIALNNMIQKVANHNVGGDCCMKVGDTTYYEGDLVIQKANNYKAKRYDDSISIDLLEHGDLIDKENIFVANGETGIIVKINNKCAVIDFDGIKVVYTRDNMHSVGLGYSISIHKSQGSSIKNVILCTPQSHTFMLNSNLIYVGLTRMKEKCYHIGSIKTVNIAVQKKANLNRHTFMQELLNVY